MQNEDAIDAVITWVDGSDPKWKAKKDKFLGREDQSENASATRYADNDEIFYCLASILKNAPFIRKIHIVTDDQVPDVADRLAKHFGTAATKKIKIVDHREVFADYEEFLPTFNSISIESMVHRIPDLADMYLYFNDDVMLIRPTKPSDFFHNGRPVLRGKLRAKCPLRIIQAAKSISNLIVQQEKFRRVSFKEAQCNAADLFGRRRRYFWHDHTPHAFRKSSLEEFFDGKEAFLISNIKYKIRNKKQFLISSLAYCLELRRGNDDIRDPNLLYLKFAKKLNQQAYFQRKLGWWEETQPLFLCVQGFEMAEKQTRAHIVAWLDEILLSG